MAALWPSGILLLRQDQSLSELFWTSWREETHYWIGNHVHRWRNGSSNHNRKSLEQTFEFSDSFGGGGLVLSGCNFEGNDREINEARGALEDWFEAAESGETSSQSCHAFGLIDFPEATCGDALMRG